MFHKTTHISLILVLLISGLCGVSQNTYRFNNDNTKEGLYLTDSRDNEVELAYNLNDLTVNVNTIDGKDNHFLTISGIFLPGTVGAPDLPKIGRYITIPQGAHASIQLLDSKYQTIDNIELMPAAELPLDDNDDVPIRKKDDAIYSRNAFYPSEPFRLSEARTIRGLNVVLLQVTPFQYNPVTKELRVFHHMKLKIDHEGGSSIYGDQRLRSPEWDHILSDLILNYEQIPHFDYHHRRKNLAEGRLTGCEYLIITPDNDDFIRWGDSIKNFRTRQGIVTQCITVTECGGNDYNAIRNYIHNAYNNWDVPPTSVLLLGDHNTDGTKGIVSHSLNDHPGGVGYNPYISDNAYADVNGDALPDIVIGRITARNDDELALMIGKNLSYERTPPTNTTFYDRPITAMGFQLERWFQLCSEVVNGFWEYGLGKHPVRINAIYQGTPGARWSTYEMTPSALNCFGPNGTGYVPSTMSHLTDWTGNSSKVNDAINNGAFIIQHRDHGAEDRWGEPGYSTASIKKLTNKDLTFVMSNNCLTGKFNHSGTDGCFAEAFHRHQYGALGLIAATEVSYSFVNDVYVWGVYDNLWPEFMPSYGVDHPYNFIRPAFGNVAGKFFLSQSSWADDWLKNITYNLFHHHGDVYMNLYSEMPQHIDINMLPVVAEGSYQYHITAEEGSIICLSNEVGIIGTGEGTDTSQIIEITPQDINSEVWLTITKQNHYRYSQRIKVIPTTGPYLIFNSFTIDDSQCNNNQSLDYSENAAINLALHNVGFETINNISVTLKCNSPYIEITEPNATFETIDSNDIVTLNNAFRIRVSDSIPDQTKIAFSIEMTAGTYHFNDSFETIVNAPKVIITDMYLTNLNYDTIQQMNKGDSTLVHFTIHNAGHSQSPEIQTSFYVEAPFVNTIENEALLSNIEVGTTREVTFMTHVAHNAPEGGIIPCMIELQTGSYYSINEHIIKLGHTIEDFEDEDLNSNILWSNNGPTRWIREDNDAFEGDYCLRSAEIANNKKSSFIAGFHAEEPGTLSFYYKISSAHGDIFSVSVNNDEILQCEGENEWQRFEYNIEAGQYLFKFTYKKDSDGCAGDDCARIDFIQLPPKAELIIYAGDDIELCGDTPIMPNSYAHHYSSLSWATSGDGTFNDYNIAQPSYTLGDVDKELGTVTLSLTATDANAKISTDSIRINILPNLNEYILNQPQGPNQVDVFLQQESTYHIDYVADGSSYKWNLSPEHCGQIIPNNNQTRIIWNDEFSGQATLSITAANECSETSPANIIINVINSSSVDDNSTMGYLIYPCPVSDILFIEIPESNNSPTSISLFSTTGEIVMEQYIPAQREQSIISFNLSRLPSGTYIIRIYDSQNCINKKIIKSY